ncbi:MAG: hypothetical protein DRQ51_09515 [Gammaproteobacteria bacterium]|nr:MAG: hypothetical protein DRQ51_09515 [Gammaproteobacteria bacterium]
MNYIGSYFLIFFLKICSYLPISALFFLGRNLGSFLYHVVPSRRKIALKNCYRAYPQKNSEFRKNIIKKSFQSLGIALFEYAIIWFWDESKLKNLLEIKNPQYLDQTLLKGKGAIILLAHFNTVETVAILLSIDKNIAAVIFPPNNKIIAKIINNKRKKYIRNIIHYKNLRQMIKSLRNNTPLLYSPDQSKYERGAPYIDFFNTKVKTTTGTIKLTSISKTTIIPTVHHRDTFKKKYILEFLPPLKNIPTNDINADTSLINKTLEKMIKMHPDQYMWLHKRFKEILA